jgi:hypothetical protein
MGAASIVFGLIQALIAFSLLYLVGMTAYFVVNRTDAEKAPSENWPAWYREIVHEYPTKYSVSETSNVIPNVTPNNVFTGASTGDCVNNSKKGCKVDTDCVGFVYNSTSNVCTTLSSVDDLIFDPKVTSNTLYTVEGSEPTRYYATYAGKTADAATTASNKILAYIATDYFACSSNCSSNTSCLGFTFNPTTRNCVQQSAIASDKLSPDATLSSYILTNGLTLMSADTETF